jgi:hypothetical protein
VRKSGTVSAPKKSKREAGAMPAAAGSVDAFMDRLDHPLKAEIEAVRRVILAADASIQEAIKWNGPSFRTTEFFATFHLRPQDRVQLIFHLGAKVRKPAPKITLTDSAGLVKWLAPDRCTVTLAAGPTGAKQHAALAAIVREWIAYV